MRISSGRGWQIMAIKLIADIFGVFIEMFLLVCFYTTLLGAGQCKRWQLMRLYGVMGLIDLLSSTMLDSPSLRTVCFLGASIVPAFAYGGKWRHKIFYAFIFTAVVAGNWVLD